MAAPGLVLQVLGRGGEEPARVGFTVTKKVGNAVVRNRIRRRLKEVVRLHIFRRPLVGADLVVIGREAALHRPFGALQKDFRRAMARAGIP